MKLVKWEKLPQDLQVDDVKPYYEALRKRRISLGIKRFFDIICSFIMIVLLSPILLVLSIAIKLDSKGPILYKQERVTQYGRKFRVWKFRSMVANADQIGSLVTKDRDPRITHMGSKLRGTRLDELPQLFNILMGDMTFVGTRPEVQRYVDRYTDEMKATLLLPAGVTSKASIEFKDEAELLAGTVDVDRAYVEKVLPQKMVWNLKAIREFSIFGDFKLLFETVLAVIK